MRFRGLNLNLLVALDALLTERSVSGAARRIYMSQSGMSNVLSGLREHFHDDLLKPVGRRMVLTSLGEQLRVPVHQLMLQIEMTVDIGQAFERSTSERHFTVAVSDYVAELMMTGVSMRMNAEAPNVTLEIVRPNNMDSRMIESGEVDILIMADPYMAKDHPAEELYKEDHVVVAWCGNEHLTPSGVSREAFFQLGHIGVRFGRSRWATFTSFAERQIALLPETRRVEVLVPALSSVPRLLIGTQRLAVLHRRYAELVAETLPLVTLPLPFAIPQLSMMMQFHRVRQNDAGVEWLRGIIREAAQPLRQA